MDNLRGVTRGTSKSNIRGNHERTQSESPDILLNQIESKLNTSRLKAQENLKQIQSYNYEH